ncbi:DUF6879 family protein [Nocardia sp. CDC160]|uniref:DUF6879 family protein n=1 Tax=Nocardia sp. CDC160 TaxID=3112166 RepID=UPI002DBDDEB4|nr:DUF6879 family protein [Nocardia sp. CDC160]MEC3919748.1 hypothetical protein [Nocardia sp. CDC160]
MLHLPNDWSVWLDLFHGCQKQAFHLEVRDSYGVPQESERLRRFLEGEPDLIDDYKSSWVALVQETTARGVEISRVRVVTVPHSDYQRWLLSVTGGNVEAGEDIRYLPRHLAGEVPPDDWWLFDDERVVFNLVDENGSQASAGMAVTTDPRIVEYCRSVKQRLWELATPYAEYAKK